MEGIKKLNNSIHQSSQIKTYLFILLLLCLSGLGKLEFEVWDSSNHPWKRSISFHKSLTQMFSLLRIVFCVKFVILSICSSMTSVPTVSSHDLFLMSATHSAGVFKSSIQRWDIDDGLKQHVSDNMNGEILFSAALQLEDTLESLWNSGLGSLELHIKAIDKNPVRNDHMDVTIEESDSLTFSLMCVYMSVSGADGRFNVS